MTSEELKPKNGQSVYYNGENVGTVSRVEENLCWVNYKDGSTNPFIWRFKVWAYENQSGRLNDGYRLNFLHLWRF